MLYTVVFYTLLLLHMWYGKGERSGKQGTRTCGDRTIPCSHEMAHFVLRLVEHLSKGLCNYSVSTVQDCNERKNI